MKTGKHYFGLLTEDEQRNFKEACEEQRDDFNILMGLHYRTFEQFIECGFHWNFTQQGFKYWCEISVSKRDKQPKEKPCIELVIESIKQSPKQPLATFRLIFIYSVIVFLVMCLLMVIHTASYKQGYKIGYRNGIEKVDSIVNYEELTPESIEAVQKLQLNTMRDESK